MKREAGGLGVTCFASWAKPPGSCVFFSREISKHQVPRRTPYPYNYAAADSNRRECAHCCCWGWFWVLMRAPDCLEPSLKYEIWVPSR